jgi:hypothetical protein
LAAMAPPHVTRKKGKGAGGKTDLRPDRKQFKRHHKEDAAAEQGGGNGEPGSDLEDNISNTCLEIANGTEANAKKSDKQLKKEARKQRYSDILFYSATFVDICIKLYILIWFSTGN